MHSAFEGLLVPAQVEISKHATCTVCGTYQLAEGSMAGWLQVSPCILMVTGQQNYDPKDAHHTVHQGLWLPDFRYEGEFVDNRMEGVGVYSWHDGTMYKGEWKNDKMHGCGIKRSLQESGELEVEAGHFKHDKFVGLSSDCDMAAAEEASQKAQKAACLSCGLLQGDPTQQPQQAADLAAPMTHDAAFSMRNQFVPNLKGGQPEGRPKAAVKNASPPLPGDASPASKPRLPLRQFWLPWSLWHS